ncbi:polypeptide N-acetylgalactosaminyltransferase 11-like [Vombatus ursinus]|uniref:polypeptide N-acetylgalactosaminyltransferase 11-like n=1 Tax=Vombatus ursinus TaxID=29139 RepID=UPI000FFD2835|nr:polypeptide N-acetylgalactosaminyltransferase 11-like [Vombatus ursinus]
MRNLRTRHFGHGCIFTSLIWTMLFFIYLNYIEVNLLLKNVPLKGTGPYQPFFTKFSSNFSNNSKQIRPQLKINKVENKLDQDIKATNNIVISPELDMIFNENVQIRDLGFEQHGFNILISNQLSYHRHVPDTRSMKCQVKFYPYHLPVASVIICFYKEVLSALLRTVHSVLDHTPWHLLHEIILVDDHSEFDYLKEDLRKHMKEKFPEKVKLIRNDKREGLIRGRMIGVINATGEVLVFLDSHCEVNKMWLQPLLFAIQKDYRMVVCPLIDAISAYTLKYMSSPILRGGFTWNLHFKWEQVPPSNLLGPEGAAAPIKSPTMAGGIFAINRQYFFEIEQYDSGMNTWGGENLEISFRIWMCGGKLFVIPCSRVGHISRKMLSHKAREIMDSLQYNSLRLAHVWLDEYKEQFFLQRPDLRRKEYGNISERIELRKTLGCKSFQWYLDNIYPELKLFPLSAKEN